MSPLFKRVDSIQKAARAVIAWVELTEELEEGV